VGSDNYPPFIYLNNDSTPTGIDVDIATEAFARIGYAVRFEIIDWEQKTKLVESGAIDCIWGCFSMDGREQLYRWVGPYMSAVRWWRSMPIAALKRLPTLRARP